MKWADLVEMLIGFILGGFGIGAVVNHFFNKKLEQFKNNLQANSKIAESYNIKRHDACAEIYKRVRIAQGSVKSLQGFGYASTYADHDVSDFEDMLKQLKVLNKQRQRFVSLFKEDVKANIPIDRNRGVKEWREYEKVLNANDARANIQEARNELVLSELYLSESTRGDFHKILKDLNLLLFDIEHQNEAPTMNKPNTFQSEREIGRFIDELVEKINSELKGKQ